MIRVALIDDEKDSLNNLRYYLNELFIDIEVVGEAENVELGLQLIQKTKPELIFLDINMPDGTGFDLLEQLPNKDISVIFITAYDYHAVNAFRYSAIDFILKPIDPDHLAVALEKFRKKEDFSNLEQRLLNLIENKTTPKKIALPTFEGFKFVLTEDIYRCESDGGYTHFYLSTGEKILVSRSIKEYDELLSGNHFYRIHQSYLVNLKYVKEYKKGEGGSVILEDQTELLVARRRKDGFLSAMMEYSK